jgi:hypothetical protein
LPGATVPLAALAPAARRAALHRLGRFLRRLHDAEVVHRDLKPANLVAWPTPRGVAYAVVDLDGARATRRPVPWRRRARDLARLDASVGPAVSRAARHRVLRGYVASFERAGLPLRDLARRVAAHRPANAAHGAPAMKQAPPPPGPLRPPPPRPPVAAAAALAVGVLNTATFATGLPFFRVLFGEESAGTGAIDAWSRGLIDAMRRLVGDDKASLLAAFLALGVALTALKAFARFLQDAWTAALTRRAVLDVAERSSRTR